MFLDTQPADLGDDGQQDPWGHFRVNHPSEILNLLRQLRDGSVPVNLSAPYGHHMTTVVWAVDDGHQRLSFDVGGLDTIAEGIVQGNEATLVAYLEAVKLQFDLHDLMMVRSATHCAMQAQLPREIYRFQRRSAYRVRTLERSSPTAHLRHPSMPEMLLKLRILDVSIGGCSLAVDNNVPQLQAGTGISGVRIELDGDTRFEVGLQLQHVSATQGAERGQRVGCEWIGLSGQAARALQHYIDSAQKRRRMLSLG